MLHPLIFSGGDILLYNGNCKLVKDINHRSRLFLVAALAMIPAAFAPPALAPPITQFTLRVPMAPLDIEALVPVQLKPNYDVEVLQPLHNAQTKLVADKAAQEAAQRAKDLQVKQLATQKIKTPQTAPITPQSIFKVEQLAAPITGSCAEWIAAAGIVDIASATRLINWESGCDPNAINPSSGACNVAQELPCGKSGCVLGDGACSVNWMNKYVLKRYGSWAAAVIFHLANNYY